MFWTESCGAVSRILLIFISATTTGTPLIWPIPQLSSALGSLFWNCCGTGSIRVGNGPNDASGAFPDRFSNHIHVRGVGRGGVSRGALVRLRSCPECWPGPEPGLEPRYLGDSRRAGRLEDMAHPQRLGLLLREPAPDFQPRHFSISRSVLRRAHRWPSMGSFVYPFSKDVASGGPRSDGRPGCTGARHRAPGMFCRRVLLRQTDFGRLGRHVY